MSSYESVLTKRIVSNGGLARCCEWRINKGKLFSPMVFLGINAGSKPFPWKEGVQPQGILVNALAVSKSTRISQYFQEKLPASLHDYLDYKGALMLDSGGFKVLELYSKMEEREEGILVSSSSTIQYMKLYRQMKTDFAVIPDLPYQPEIALGENLQRLNANLATLNIFSKLRLPSSTILIPVLHPFPHPHYHRKILRRLVKNQAFQRLMEKTVAIGVGGLVPYLLKRKGRGHIEIPDVIDFLCLIRSAFPDKFLHVFGAGGCSWMPILFYLGVDSVDTTGWRVRAAYGKIQLSGISDRSVYGTKAWGSRSIYKDKMAQTLIKDCHCPACEKIRSEGWDIDYFQSEEETSLSFKLRAIHNAYTYLNQARKIRKIIKRSGNLDDYLETLFRNNPKALAIFRTAQKKVHIYKLSKRFGWF